MMRRRLRGVWLLLLLLPGVLMAAGIQVMELSARAGDQAYMLNAQIEYDLSDEAREALQNGVPLTLEVHLQLRRDGAWIWEKDVLDSRLRYQIRYQALGDVYQVHDLQSGSKQVFSTEAAALKALGKLSDLTLVTFDRLQQGDSYILSLRSTLDIEALPLPLRPIAYLDAGWRLQSEWKEWRLDH